MSFFFVYIIPSAFVIWNVGIIEGVKVKSIIQDDVVDGNGKVPEEAKSDLQQVTGIREEGSIKE